MGDTLVLEDTRRTRRLPWWGWALVVMFVLLVIGFAAGGWYFAGQLTAVPQQRVFEANNEVLATSGDEVSLRNEGYAAQGGTWGLRFSDGRQSLLTEVVSAEGDAVTWTYEPLVGAGPASGDEVRVDEYVWVGDPQSAHGIGFSEVVLDGELGPNPAWVVPGDDDRWVVIVHGHSATREEALRFIPIFHDLGHPVIVPSYRGDGVAPDPERGVTFGVVEWKDVETAVRYAVDQGADDVVVMGMSMGGAITASFLQQSALESVVAGAILDSPVLSMDELLDFQADLEGVPEPAEPPLLFFTELFARFTSDLDTRQLEFVDTADRFDVPILLIHGDADGFVPVEPSDAFAEARPETTYLRVPEAGHVRSWNTDRERYERTVRDWLATLP